MPTIKELRDRKGWTQTRLAKEIGVTSQAVVYWESGQKMPTVIHLRALARALDSTMDEITLGWEQAHSGPHNAPRGKPCP